MHAANKQGGTLKNFTITQQHIDLLKRAELRWEDCEFGAPAIDCKRPYGNSSVYSDIAEIINIKPEGDNDCFSDDQIDLMSKLHRETLTALLIFIDIGKMETGQYTPKLDHWERIEETIEPLVLKKPSKDFFRLSGLFHHHYTEETKHPLQEDNAIQSEYDAYDAILWHDENGHYFSIQNRVSIEKRSEAWITPKQALKLLDVLEEQRDRLQELCGKEGQ